MDASEATKIVMSRFRSLDPENASRIMGFILIQDQGEKEMIRLAFGSEALLLSYVNQAKVFLGIHSNSPSDLSTSLRPKNQFLQTAPRIVIPNQEFHVSNPSLTGNSPRPVSYASVVNGSHAGTISANDGSGSPSLPFCGNEFGAELLSSCSVRRQVQDQFLFPDDSLLDPIMSQSGRSDSWISPYGDEVGGVPSPHYYPFHRRSCSVNDASFLSNLEEGVAGCGFGGRPCMYFARGFCKNGSFCKFLHNDTGFGEASEVGSPGKNASGSDELLKAKVFQQKLALMASEGFYPHGCNKYMDILVENQRSAAAAALMMGNDFHKLNRCQPERNDYSALGLGASASSSSRQIYLTFPADSTFKEDDVSSYFSNFGPVQDVRIPYQQKRMFGFVSFVYPETVKLILAKGNPHFVCDSRVLVKPYKEKGKLPDKKKHQYLDIVEYAGFLSPNDLDSRDQLDIPYGPRMLLNSQEKMLRRKLEQETEIQRAVELQGRRMMNLQLGDLKNPHHLHHFPPSFEAGRPVSFPRPSQLINATLVKSSNVNQVVSEDCSVQQAAKSQSDVIDNLRLVLEGKEILYNNIDDCSYNHEHIDSEVFRSP